jgi:hypothetical protein
VDPSSPSPLPGKLSITVASWLKILQEKMAAVWAPIFIKSLVFI